MTARRTPKRAPTPKKMPNLGRISIETKAITVPVSYTGTGFSVVHGTEHKNLVDVVYDTDILVAQRAGKYAVLLFDVAEKTTYQAKFDIVIESTTDILYHKDSLMISAVTQKDGQRYIMIIVDELAPINNLYVSTETK